MGMQHLRIELEGDREWIEWLLPHLDQRVDVLPAIRPAAHNGARAQHIGDPTAGRPEHEPPEGARSEEPLDVHDLVTLYGEHFDMLEVVLPPPSVPDADPSWQAVRQAVQDANRLGKQVLLGGVPEALQGGQHALVQELAAEVDAIGIEAWGSTTAAAVQDTDAHFWHALVERLHEQMGAAPAMWITRLGSPSGHDVLTQLQRVQDALDAPVERIYWDGIQDPAHGPGHDPAQGPDHGPEGSHVAVPGRDGLPLWTATRPRLLAQVLQRRRDPRDLRWLVQERAMRPTGGHIVVTGGAGFVGTNLTDRLTTDGEDVLVLDDLSRQGSLENLLWLRDRHGHALKVHITDIRDRRGVIEAVKDARAVFHLAAQVAVTTSVADPRDDFTINAEGTLNVLEAVRHYAPDAFVLYASTNKVYGELSNEALEEHATRWESRRRKRLNQAQGGHAPRPLAFATPYGCSKGAADQYVVDYAHTYGLDATVFRMSCIYGPHQNGTADQGWLVHFLKSAAQERPLTIYGDGKQVRDVLHVDDLVDAYVAAMERSEAVRGRAWDIGGGRHHTLSLLELLEEMRAMGCPVPALTWRAARPSDQRYFVADIQPLADALGWEPRVDVKEGLRNVWEHMRRPEVLA